MTAQYIADAFFIRPRMLAQEAVERHQDSGGTEAALQRMIAFERRLQNAEAARLGILQAAFKRNHALQCGFCTAGILMSLDTFLREHPLPDEASIRDVLSGHLCRCTGYTPIVRAALEAAAELADQDREKTDA